ncbi:hypothetical protein ACOZ4I_05660 [Haloarcula salina]|uniref:hypothetical protein n=1 Tax=Haloarcula salina TaxID=1429914 RepID=UPI003C6EE3E1
MGTNGADSDRIDPTDRAAVRAQLERFAGTGGVTEADDGTLRADFGGRAHVAIAPDGSLDTGMALHAFDGQPEVLVFDHGNGELRAELDGGTTYVFRRP